jgi:hypothetical protein
VEGLKQDDTPEITHLGSPESEEWPSPDKQYEESYRAALESAANLKWTREYSTGRELEQHVELVYQGSTAWLPALAIPVLTKAAFECPDSHIELLREVAHETDKVLIVGWRGSETHFLDLWKGSEPRAIRRIVAVLGRPNKPHEDVREIVSNLIQAQMAASADGVVVSELGFSGFLQDGHLEDFLET